MNQFTSKLWKHITVVSYTFTMGMISIFKIFSLMRNTWIFILFYLFCLFNLTLIFTKYFILYLSEIIFLNTFGVDYNVCQVITMIPYYLFWKGTQRCCQERGKTQKSCQNSVLIPKGSDRACNLVHSDLQLKSIRSVRGVDSEHVL